MGRIGRHEDSVSSVSFTSVNRLVGVWEIFLRGCKEFILVLACRCLEGASPGVQHKSLARSKFFFETAGFRTLVFYREGEAVISEPYQDWICYSGSYEEALARLLEERAEIVLFDRYSSPGWRTVGLVRRFPGRFIFEHNTVDRQEWLLKLKALSLRDIAYILRTEPARLWVEYVSPVIREWMFGAFVLRSALAGVCISQSVADDLLLRYRGYRTRVVGNGIDLDSVFPIEIDLSLIGKEVVLLFVCGSPAPWTGGDRLMRSLVAYTGERKFRVHLVGRFQPSCQALVRRLPSSVSVEIHGRLSREQISSIASCSHIGVGSLGLHRLNMISGSTLKVNEYVAMGLPVVAGYDETNLPADYPYLFRVPSDESLLDLDAVFEFLSFLRLAGFSSRKMRDESRALVDMRNKVIEILDFFNELKIKLEK